MHTTSMTSQQLIAQELVTQLLHSKVVHFLCNLPNKNWSQNLYTTDASRLPREDCHYLSMVEARTIYTLLLCRCHPLLLSIFL